MTTREDYDRFLAEVRKQTGIEALTSDDAGLVSVSVDEKYNVNLQFVEASGKVLCFIEVATLPHDAPKAVYRDLLAGGLFGKETAGGYFALEAETETVVYNYFFDLETAALDSSPRSRRCSSSATSGRNGSRMRFPTSRCLRRNCPPLILTVSPSTGIFTYIPDAAGESLGKVIGKM